MGNTIDKARRWMIRKDGAMWRKFYDNRDSG